MSGDSNRQGVQQQGIQVHDNNNDMEVCSDAGSRGQDRRGVQQQRLQVHDSANGIGVSSNVDSNGNLSDGSSSATMIVQTNKKRTVYEGRNASSNQGGGKKKMHEEKNDKMRLPLESLICDELLFWEKWDRLQNSNLGAKHLKLLHGIQVNKLSCGELEFKDALSNLQGCGVIIEQGGCYLLCADRAATNNFISIHTIGDNEAGRTVVPLIYLSDDNAFPRLCHLEATESIAFIKKKENSYYETKERSKQKET